MSDRILVSTRKGLAITRTPVRRLGRRRADVSRRPGDGSALRPARRHDLCRAQARPFRTEAAPLAGRRPDLCRDCHAGIPARHAGRAFADSDLHARAGRSGAAGQAVGRRGAGRAVPLRRSRRRAGNSCVRSGTCRDARNGSAAATRMPPCIRSRPIRAIPIGSSWRSPAAACGRRPTTARTGRWKARVSSPPTCRPSSRACAMLRTRIGSRAAHQSPTSCGCSITAGSSARPTQARIGCSSSRPATISASRSPPIRRTRRPPGSCPRSRTKSACRATARCAVTRTRDGGKTWEALREGLPQRDAYDLIYRHGLDVDESGNAPRDGLDHRRALGERKRRRALAARQRAPAADLCGAICVDRLREVLAHFFRKM